MPKDKPKIIGLLESRLKVLLDRTINIDETYERTGIYSINNGAGFKYITDNEIGHKIGLIPVKPTELILYYLSLLFTYNYSEKRLKSISIILFSETYEKLFRAEWGINDSETIHAQPHWHFHFEKGSHNESSWDDGAKIFNKEVVEKNNLIKNLHFAMSATWHKKGNHVIILTDCKDNEIGNWLEGVLSYIINQLKYINK